MNIHKRIMKHIFIISICFLLFAKLNAQDQNKPKPPKEFRQKQYTIEQATSERAQLNTIAFSGLAFITGSFGADCFFPPGKVADFFGFQYMRDNDKNEMGHNTDFLTRIANNVIKILNDEQLQQLKDLANKQATIYDEFAKKRMVLIKAFRDQLEGNIPNGKAELSKEEVMKYCAKLYELDAELSYYRGLVAGKILYSLSESQKAELSKLDFGNSSTWTDLPKTLDKRSMSHRAHVCVMTYASEMFSWYAGSANADVYFCPERHGTYFGGFYLKDFPAMGNRDYNISTSLTGDKGKDFIDVLTNEQAECLKQTVKIQETLLKEIIKIRTDVSTELRKAINNETPDKEKIFSLIRNYGELDGEMSYNYVICFAKIRKSLTEKQKEQLTSIRDLNIFPEGTFLFSDPIVIPKIENTDFLFKN
jgi:hypothetical protein